MSVVDRLRQRRSAQFGLFLSVGAVGMVIDLAITLALLGTLPPVAANAVGWSVAVTHNFLGNWWLTFGRPDGSLARQYAAYVGVHAATFSVRALVLTAVLAATAVPPAPASLLGIAAAAGLNFLGSEQILGRQRGRLVAGVNHVAHWVWSSRVRRVLLAVGLYDTVYRAYAHALAAVSPGEHRTVTVGDASATLAAGSATATVSILHTLENERDVLRQFVADVDADDRVLDVGANLGVFTALALDAGGAVTAVEPHAPTASQLRQNCPAATVHECVLGCDVGTVGLATHTDAAGTQRGQLVGGESVPQLPGDRVADAPTIVKIDVEGAEEAVLIGLQRVLGRANPRVVYVETHGAGRQAAVRGRLAAAGYGVTETWPVGADEKMLRATNE